MAFRNMCLAENGGTLGSGANDALRDNDFSTWAVGVSGQSGSYSAEILFPSCHIAFIKYGTLIVSYLYDGNAEAYGYINLKVNGSWVQIDSGHAISGGNASIGVSDESKNNGGLGWDNVTGIQVTGSVSGYNTSTARSMVNEIQAWAKIGGFATII